MSERVEWPADLDLGSPLPATVRQRLVDAAGEVHAHHVALLEFVPLVVQHLRDAGYTGEWDSGHVINLLWDRYRGALADPGVREFPDAVADAVLEVAGLCTWPADLAERDRYLAAVRTVAGELISIASSVSQ